MHIAHEDMHVDLNIAFLINTSDADLESEGGIDIPTLARDNFSELLNSLVSKGESLASKGEPIKYANLD
jgi:hypothetical protein